MYISKISMSFSRFPARSLCAKENVNGLPKVFRSLRLCVPYTADPILALKLERDRSQVRSINEFLSRFQRSRNVLGGAAAKRSARQRDTAVVKHQRAATVFFERFVWFFAGRHSHRG